MDSISAQSEAPANACLSGQLSCGKRLPSSQEGQDKGQSQLAFRRQALTSWQSLRETRLWGKKTLRFFTSLSLLSLRRLEHIPFSIIVFITSQRKVCAHLHICVWLCVCVCVCIYLHDVPSSADTPFQQVPRLPSCGN